MRTGRTPIVLSWSGGKDSMLALERLRADPMFEVVSLLTSVSTEFDRISIHGVRRPSKLPPDVDPCGERGEFHTFVYAGPQLSAAVPIQLGEQVLRDGRFQYCDLLDPD